MEILSTRVKVDSDEFTANTRHFERDGAVEVPDIRIAGHRLEVVSQPPASPDLPWTVFLHEGLGSAGHWRDFPARVAARTGCGALTYSRWGYGRSDARPRSWPATFLDEEATAILPALLAKFGIARPVLFGHSDGGSIALIYAAAFPDAARGVIAEAAHVMVEEIQLTGVARTRQRFLDGDLRARLRTQHGEHVDDTVLGWTDTWLRPDLRTWDIRPRLPSIRCPVLVIQGREDDYGTLAHVEDTVAGVGGRAETLVLDDCGHVPHREKAREVLAAVTRFIQHL
jgi:pimeloyl-ACP methyl ester carboxylesterase